MDPFTFVARALGCEAGSLTMDSAFGSHPQWDSLGHLSILNAIEEQLGIKLDVYSAEKFSTMSEICKLPCFRGGSHAEADSG
jgi:acyl carrier protein